MLSLSEENYLKAIYHLGKFGAVSVSTSAVAQQMDTKASSVTDMIKKLSEKDLVSYRKYQGAKLTNEGRKIAASVVRKHRLWEVFLVEHLNFSWDEVHDVAEQLEHIKSEKLINQLDAFLEFPTHDPHGDPIPDKDGQIKKTEKVLLSQIQESETCMCIGVKDTSKDFLKYLDKHRIALGTSFKVLSKESFDESMTIEVNAVPLSISKAVSNNLYVKLSE
ncbi:metal-dependent transcriptional regulator [Mangrovimonas sp. TPBH4]|uniref:metal-dependent transcriptional regulator n=1 Tax=Mangrovimonas sp. TPBH4 TaxID=1645914 RepID=UPI0006B42C33|nr:metal-dependent transcriptional regulator [Mangrovimonas sp. TPBH4]